MKRVLLLTVITCVFLIGFAQNKKKNQEVDIVSHQVPVGETVRTISKKYIVNPSEIYKLNKFAIEGISAGMVLQIPVLRKEEFIKSSDENKDIQNSAEVKSLEIHHTVEDTVKSKRIQLQKKAPPLLVIDGEAVTNNKKSTEKELSEMNPEELEEVIYLKEPLYIINGVHYSEKEMFGPNPTSPYAPLDQQEIIKLVILQDKEAIEKYGKKGEKGVVIITTKNAKPVIQK